MRYPMSDVSQVDSEHGIWVLHIIFGLPRWRRIPSSGLHASVLLLPWQAWQALQAPYPSGGSRRAALNSGGSGRVKWPSPSEVGCLNTRKPSKGRGFCASDTTLPRILHHRSHDSRPSDPVFASLQISITLFFFYFYPPTMI